MSCEVEFLKLFFRMRREIESTTPKKRLTLNTDVLTSMIEPRLSVVFSNQRPIQLLVDYRSRSFVFSDSRYFVETNIVVPNELFRSIRSVCISFEEKKVCKTWTKGIKPHRAFVTIQCSERWCFVFVFLIDYERRPFIVFVINRQNGKIVQLFERTRATHRTDIVIGAFEEIDNNFIIVSNTYLKRRGNTVFNFVVYRNEKGLFVPCEISDIGRETVFKGEKEFVLVSQNDEKVSVFLKPTMYDFVSEMIPSTFSEATERTIEMKVNSYINPTITFKKVKEFMFLDEENFFEFISRYKMGVHPSLLSLTSWLGSRFELELVKDKGWYFIVLDSSKKIPLVEFSENELEFRDIHVYHDSLNFFYF